MSTPRSYAELHAEIDPIATALERIAHRLRQGAISRDVAATMLGDLAKQLDPPVVKTATITRRERPTNSFTSRRTAVSYEWVTVFYRDGERVTQAVSPSRKAARERIETLGYTEVEDERQKLIARGEA